MTPAEALTDLQADHDEREPGHPIEAAHAHVVFEAYRELRQAMNVPTSYSHREAVEEAGHLFAIAENEGARG